MKIGAYEFTAPSLEREVYYVYFDINTGDIHKVTNEFDDSTDYQYISYIKEDPENVKHLLDGTVQLHSKMVSFDITNYQYVLTDKQSEEEQITNQALMHEITYQPDAQIVIRKDVKNQCWHFSLSDSFKKMLEEKGVVLKTTMLFSITEKYNPNVLHRTLYVQFQDLMENDFVSIPFEDESEFDNIDVSLYTIKKFDSYSFEVVNE